MNAGNIPLLFHARPKRGQQRERESKRPFRFPALHSTSHVVTSYPRHCVALERESTMRRASSIRRPKIGHLLDMGKYGTKSGGLTLTLSTHNYYRDRLKDGPLVA